METIATDKTDVQEIIYTRDMMDYEINVYGTEEEPLFLAKDIIKWLGYADTYPTRNLLALCDDSEQLRCKICTSGQSREQFLITEDGLYEICMRSQTEKAKKVRKFIKGILKELRTKGYVATNNNIEIANAINIIIVSIQNIIVIAFMSSPLVY